MRGLLGAIAGTALVAVNALPRVRFAGWAFRI